ncbi:hypothetical protein Tco_0427364 [Tanacetum coccineum]
MGTPTLVCVWSCLNFNALAGRPFRCVCQIKGCLPQCLLTQRVPSRLTELRAPECPYHFLRIPMRLLVPILHRTTRMAVRVPPAMSSGLSASMAEVAVMSESAFCKRFRSSYKSLPSVSPPDLPLRKRYQGTSELVEDSDEDNDEEDEEIEESIDSDSVSEDTKDKGPTAEDKDPAAGDEGLTTGIEGPDDESHGMDDESYGLDDESHGMDDESHGLDDEGHGVESDGLGLEEEEAVLGGQQQAALVVGTVVSVPLGLRYRALRRQELALEEDQVYSTFEVGQGYGSAPESERPERVSTSRQPTLTTWTDLEDGGLIRDHAVRLEELSPTLFERYDRDIGELFTRPLLALKSWAGQTDVQRAALWHAISDVQGKNQDLRLQLPEERRARLELAEVVDSMR